MLQQTQVDRVIPKYKNFIKTYPNFLSLANASKRDLLTCWQGLGYNRRALHLQRTASVVSAQYRGRLPSDLERLLELPGIGPYTAGAIRAFAFDKPSFLIETNVRAVFTHFFFNHKKLVSDQELLKEIQATLPRVHFRRWYSALMDYGSELKKYEKNINLKNKKYIKQSIFKGSDRQLRGAIIRMLTGHTTVSFSEIQQETKRPALKLRAILKDLKKETMIREIRIDQYSL